MENDLLTYLTNATVSLTLCLLFLFALRLPLRRWFGVAVTYQAWLIMPIALIASLLPNTPTIGQTPTIIQPLTHWVSDTSSVMEHDSFFNPQLVLWLWFSGFALSLSWLSLQHLNFIKKLGKLSKTQGVYQAETAASGPVLVGIWRPKIIVPVDFYHRYSEQEQQLIITHEKNHENRGDHIFNSGFAALLCVFWFHPLVHIAIRYFRIDQELACDANVITCYPNSQRTYAEALLKTQINASHSAIACQLHSSHPLKERIMQIHKAQTNKPNNSLGKWFLLFILGLSAYGAWAVSPNTVTATIDSVGTEIEDVFGVQSEITVDGVHVKQVTHSKPGEAAVILVEGKTVRWEISYTLNSIETNEKQKTALIALRIKRNNHIVSTPTLLATLGQPVAVNSQSAENPKNNFIINLVTTLPPN